MQIGDIYLVRANLVVNGNSSSVGFHYEQTAGPTVDVDRTGALAIGFSAVAGDIENVVAADTQIASIDVIQVSDLISGVLDAPSLGVFTFNMGNRPGEALPLTKAVVVKLFQTELPGKHNGRQYWPGISEDSTDGNVVDDFVVLTGLEQINVNARVISETIGGDTFDFVHTIWHPNLLPADSTHVAESSAVPTIFSQRRRRTERRGVIADPV